MEKLLFGAILFCAIGVSEKLYCKKKKQLFDALHFELKVVAGCTIDYIA